MFNVVHIRHTHTHNLCLYTRYLAREFGLNGANNVSNAQVFFSSNLSNPSLVHHWQKHLLIKITMSGFYIFFKSSVNVESSGGRDRGCDQRLTADDCEFLSKMFFSSSNLFHLWDAFAVHGYVLERSVREGGEDERGGGQHFASGASQVIFKVPLLVNLLVKVPSKRFHLNRVF